MAFETNGANWTVGKGRGYFDRKGRNGYEGERPLGNIASMSYSAEMVKKDHYDTRGDYRYRDKSLILAVNPRIAVTLDEIGVENLALLFLADVREVEQAASGAETLNIEASRVRPGYVIDLGRRFIDAETFRLEGPGGRLYAEGADYRLDARCGKLLVLRGGAVDGADDLTAFCGLEARKYKELNCLMRSSIEGRFTFVSDNASGDNFIIEFRHVSFTLAGEAALITDRDEMMRIRLEGEIQADKGHPDSLFGKTIVIE